MKLWLWILTAIIILQASAIGVLYSMTFFGYEELAGAINENADCIAQYGEIINEMYDDVAEMLDEVSDIIDRENGERPRN